MLDSSLEDNLQNKLSEAQKNNIKNQDKINQTLLDIKNLNNNLANYKNDLINDQAKKVNIENDLNIKQSQLDSLKDKLQKAQDNVIATQKQVQEIQDKIGIVNKIVFPTDGYFKKDSQGKFVINTKSDENDAIIIEPTEEVQKKGQEINVFQHNPNDEKIIVTSTNLTTEQQRELTIWTASILQDVAQQAAKSVNEDPTQATLLVTDNSLSLAQDIAKNYWIEADNYYDHDHKTLREARGRLEDKLHSDIQMAEEAIGMFNVSTTTESMDSLKEKIYRCMISMIFDDGGENEWGHASQLIDSYNRFSPKYYGFSISKSDGTIHFEDYNPYDHNDKSTIYQIPEIAKSADEVNAAKENLSNKKNAENIVQNEVRNAENALNNTQNDLSQIMNQINFLESKIKKSNQQLPILQNNLNIEKNNLDNNQEQINQLIDNIKNEKQNKINYQKNYDNALKQLNISKLNLQSASDKFIIAEQNSINSQNNLFVAKNKLKLDQDNLIDLNKKQNNAFNQINFDNINIKNLKNKILNNKAMIEENSNKLVQLNKEIVNKNIVLLAANKFAKQNRDSLSQIKNDLSNKEIELGKINENVITTKKQIRELDDHITQCLNKIAQYQKDIEMIQAIDTNLLKDKSNLNKLQNELNKLSSTVKQNQNQLNSAIIEYNKAVDSLNKFQFNQKDLNSSSSIKNTNNNYTNDNSEQASDNNQKQNYLSNTNETKIISNEGIKSNSFNVYDDKVLKLKNNTIENSMNIKSYSKNNIFTYDQKNQLFNTDINHKINENYNNKNLSSFIDVKNKTLPQTKENNKQISIMSLLGLMSLLFGIAFKPKKN